MTFDNMKIQINMAVRAGSFDDSLGLANINRVITSCLLYGLISSLSRADNSYEGQVRSLCSQYLETYIGIVEGLRGKYVSYSVMKNYLKSIGEPKFVNMDESEVNKIVDLYHDKTKVELYSKYSFSQYMYNIDGIGEAQYNRLRDIHFTIMVPIFQHYIENYGIKSSDIEIYSVSNVSKNPGKEIIFKIGDIAPAKIIVDIKDILGIGKYIYDVSQYYDKYVKMSIK